jgi:predicted DsbA family dithiol-disulfide isomerase
VLISVLFPHVDGDAMFAGFNRSGKPYDIHFNRIDRLYNSRTALELSELARDRGVYDEMHTLLFSAYFHDGKNIADPDVLCDIALNVGLKQEEVKEAFEKKTYINRLTSSLEEGREKGISAVPAFIFSDGQKIIGAQSLVMYKNILMGIEKRLQ